MKTSNGSASLDLRKVTEDFSTRPAGAAARQAILDALKGSDVLTVDLGNRPNTPSFADECFGNLVHDIGFAEFKRRIRLTNVHDLARSLLVHVVGRHTTELDVA